MSFTENGISCTIIIQMEAVAAINFIHAGVQLVTNKGSSEYYNHLLLIVATPTQSNLCMHTDTI